MSASNTALPIVIAQYKRDDMGVGQEEKLHWALIIITDARELSGPCFQLVDRTYRHPDGRIKSFSWNIHSVQAVLSKTTKCLGGVQVGCVRASELATVCDLINSHAPVPKSPEWNCRDWISEVLGLLHKRYCIDTRILPPGARPIDCLLPSLRWASRATADANPVHRNGLLMKTRYDAVVRWIAW